MKKIIKTCFVIWGASMLLSSSWTKLKLPDAEVAFAVEKVKKSTQKIVVFDNATITTYNPVPGQTDDTPCVNETTAPVLEKLYWTWDLCELNEWWIQTVAVPQSNLDYVNDILWRKPQWFQFSIWDTIMITWTWECDISRAVVADAFNSRYNGQQKVDIFLLDLTKNTKCEWAQVYKIIE